jgi:hypothetical protein
MAESNVSSSSSNLKKTYKNVKNEIKEITNVISSNLTISNEPKFKSM